MSGLADIRKQLEALAKPFEILAEAAGELDEVADSLKLQAAYVHTNVLVGKEADGHLYTIRERVEEFDRRLIVLQAAIRNAMASSVMDEYLGKLEAETREANEAKARITGNGGAS